MRNIHYTSKIRLFFGLCAITVSIIISAFSNSKNQISIYYAQTEPGLYSQVDYENGICLALTIHPCAYVITEAGYSAGIADQFQLSYDKIQNYADQETPYMKIFDATPRIFVPIP